MASRQAALATAFELASRQREISVSEFFLKNRHLLGFDTPEYALVGCSSRPPGARVFFC